MRLKNPLAVRQYAEIFVRQGRPWDERWTEKLLAPLSKAANQLIAFHFQHTEGISPAPVVDRKSARVCITDQLSGFTMPIFKMVMEHGVMSSRCMKKVSDEEWRQVVIAASAHTPCAVVCCCAPSRAPRHLRPPADGASFPLAGLPPLHFVVFLCTTPLTLLPRLAVSFFQTCALLWSEIMTAILRSGGSPVSDGSVPRDDVDCDATTVANQPGFQRLVRRWKADALRVGNLPTQGAAVTTCRHLPAKGLRS